MVEINVLKFNELFASNVWFLITNIDDLTRPFPDSSLDHEPEGKYMFAILATFRFDEAKAIIENIKKPG